MIPRTFSKYRALHCLSAVMLLMAVPGQSARAGGGPENVLVVVNPRSWASVSVANHFCRLRSIPAGNIYYLDWDGSLVRTDVETFRQKILKPILKTIEKRDLGRQIDYIVYSSDYPYEIDFKADLGGKGRYASGSLTSMTYMALLVLNKRLKYTGLRSNWYARSSPDGKFTAPTHGFRAHYIWGPDGQLVQEKGLRYILSTMLAYTSGRGNSVGEAISYLRRSALADGTHPHGTIYYMKNHNVRSSTRHGRFPEAAAELKKLGVAAKIRDGLVPGNSKDVQGTMTGVARFNWNGSRSVIQPGAICENFTSFGGVLRDGAGQTPLSVFLRYGAAGSSGTVIEPYAIAAKFPHPMIHLHYARGCTLAEAYYQSVTGPYQLLIVGDPLCRPWATIPTVSAGGVKPGETVSGPLSLRPKTKLSSQGKIGHFQLFLDGRLAGQCQPGDSFDFDTKLLPDGHHELRIVAIEDSPIQTQGRVIVPVSFSNHDRTIRVATRPEKQVAWDQTLLVAAHSPGSREIIVYHNTRFLGKISGERGRLAVDPKILGLGPATLMAVGIGSEGAQDRVFAAPILMEVVPSTPLASRAAPRSRLADGLQLERADKSKTIITSTRKDDWLLQAGVKPGQSFSLSGQFQTPREEVYQFQLRYKGKLKLSVDGMTIYGNTAEKYQNHYVPLPLEIGWHRLKIEGRLTGNGRLGLSFGGRGTHSLEGKRFKHRR